jgi:hypothetical protein
MRFQGIFRVRRDGKWIDYCRAPIAARDIDAAAIRADAMLIGAKRETGLPMYCRVEDWQAGDGTKSLDVVQDEDLHLVS